MSDQQDRSSACSEFEPIYGIPQIEEQLLDGEMPQPNVDNTMEEYDQSNSDNGDGGGRTFSSADDTDLAAMHIIDQLKLKLALANAQKESVVFKAKMLEKKIEQLETGEGHGRVVEEKVAEFVEAKLTQLQTFMEEVKQLIAPINNALHIFKGDVDNRLEQLLNENGTRLQKLLEEERLKEWLATGMGQLRNVTLLRIVANQLVTSGSWNIQPNSGGLKANKTAASTWAHVRAIQPHPVTTARHGDKLVFYFEATITGTTNNSYLHIGLCGPNFDFTLNRAVGTVAGSFAMRLDGTYFASGASQSGFGKGAFANGDVVGCGLLVLPTERRLFLIKNGEIWVKPILLGSEDAKEILYPTVSAYDLSAEVVFNFGADLAAKPFKYELSQLDVVDA